MEQKHNNEPQPIEPTSAAIAANHLLPAVFLSGKHKQEQFHKDLKSLLKKYDAEIAIEDFGHDYSVNEKIVVDFNWDEDLSNRTNDGIVPQLVLGSGEDGR